MNCSSRKRPRNNYGTVFREFEVTLRVKLSHWFNNVEIKILHSTIDSRKRTLIVIQKVRLLSLVSCSWVLFHHRLLTVDSRPCSGYLTRLLVVNQSDSPVSQRSHCSHSIGGEKLRRVRTSVQIFSTAAIRGSDSPLFACLWQRSVTKAACHLVAFRGDCLPPEPWGFFGR
jgi:hypothetical protein